MGFSQVAKLAAEIEVKGQKGESEKFTRLIAELKASVEVVLSKVEDKISQLNQAS